MNFFHKLILILAGAFVYPNISAQDTLLVEPGPGTLNADRESLYKVLMQMGLTADVQFEKGSTPEHEIGLLNYIHKQKVGKEIYFFPNTTENQGSTSVQ